MKPDWKYAPDWANYLAMDSDGSWWWYEERPELSSGNWVVNDGKFDICEHECSSETLESRHKP